MNRYVVLRSNANNVIPELLALLFSPRVSPLIDRYNKLSGLMEVPQELRGVRPHFNSCSVVLLVPKVLQMTDIVARFFLKRQPHLVAPARHKD